MKFIRKQLFSVGVLVLLAAGHLFAKEPVTLENVVPPGRNRPDEPFIEEFSMQEGLRFLDSAALAWQKQRKCFACHSNYAFLMARPAIPRGLATHDKVRLVLEDRVNDPWVKKPGPYRNAEFLMIAAVLAHNDAATTGKPQPLTRHVERLEAL